MIDSKTPTPQEIKSLLLNKLREVLHYLLPAGIIKGKKFYVGDVNGNKGNSLIVELQGEKIGQWHDFETKEGGDIISLWATVFGKDIRRDFPDIINAIYDWLSTQPKITSANLRSERLGPITYKWDYHDPDGNLIACVYRYDPPSGKQFRPWDVKAQKNQAPEIRPLYNQPGIKISSTVVLVEGEKAAQSLIDVGYCATTAMNGANAPLLKTDWSPLKSKHVIIWPDNDEPGIKYAKTVAHHLKTVGVASFAIIDIPRGKPKKWDAADAVAEKINIGEFLAVKSCTTPIPAYFASHYMDDETPMPDDIIAPRILTPGGLLVLGGAPKVGKSDLLISWLTHMAAGIPFLGMIPKCPLKVFYLQTELGYFYLRERIKSLKIDPNLIQLVRCNLVATPGVRMLLNARGIEDVVDTITYFFDPTEVDVIIIDPLRNVYDADSENDNTAMLNFLQSRVEEIRYRINPNAAIILAHHTKKITKKLLEEDPFQGLSGAGSLRSFYSTGIIMHRPEESQNTKQLIFELRNGSSMESKYIDKIDGSWIELEPERLVNKDYGQKLDAERRRKHDKILEIIFNEGQKGNLYTSSMFCQVWEHKAGLGSRYSVRERIEVLTSKGYIKFTKEGATRSRNGFLCVEDMEVPTKIDPLTGKDITVFKKLLPTHFRSPQDGGLMPVENPEVWIYHEGISK